MNAGSSPDRSMGRILRFGRTLAALARRRWLAGLSLSTLVAGGGCVGANLARTPSPLPAFGPNRGLPDSAPFSRPPATSNIFSQRQAEPDDPRLAPPRDRWSADDAGEVQPVRYRSRGEPLPPGPEGEIRGNHTPTGSGELASQADPRGLFAPPSAERAAGRRRASEEPARLPPEDVDVPELARSLKPVRPQSPPAFADHADDEIAARVPAPVSFPLPEPPPSRSDAAVTPIRDLAPAGDVTPSLPASLLPDAAPSSAAVTITSADPTAMMTAEPTQPRPETPSPTESGAAPRGSSPSAADRAMIQPAPLSLEDLTIPTLIYSAAELVIHVDRTAQDQFVVPAPIQSVLIQKVRGIDRGRMLWRPVFDGKASFGTVSDGAWDVFHLTMAIPVEPEIARADAEEHVRRHQPKRRVLVDRTATGAPELAATELPWRTSEGARQARTLLPVAWSTGRAVARVQSLAGDEAEGTIRPETREGWRLLRKGLVFRAMRQFALHLESRSPVPRKPVGSLTHAEGPTHAPLGEILGASTSVTAGLRGNGKATAELTNRLSEESPADLDGAMALLGWAKALDAAGRETPPLVDQADELALAGYLAAARIDGNAHGALNDAGVLLYRLRRPAEAISVLLAAQRESEEPLVAHNLGCVYAELGRHLEALAVWRWAADTDRSLLATRRAIVRHQLRDGAPALHPDQARQLMGALKRIESGTVETVAAMPAGYAEVTDNDRQLAGRIVQAIWFLGKEMAANGPAGTSPIPTPMPTAPAEAGPNPIGSGTPDAAPAATTPALPVVPRSPDLTPPAFEVPIPTEPPIPSAIPPKLHPAGANRPTDPGVDPAPARLDPALRDPGASSPSTRGTIPPGRNP